jgi:hypothetical protein
MDEQRIGSELADGKVYPFIRYAVGHPLRSTSQLQHPRKSSLLLERPHQRQVELPLDGTKSKAQTLLTSNR